MQNIFAIFLFSLLFVSCDGFECGIQKIKRSSLISGGQESDRGEWPWLVTLHSTNNRNETKYFCGSSLVNERVLITAAHCIKPYYSYDMFALLGRHNFSDESERNWVKRNIIKRIVHEEYKNDDDIPKSLSDIAILLMESPVEYTDFIQPICLPKVDENVFNVSGTVAGHGRSSHNGDPTEISKFFHMKSVSLYDCIFSSTTSGRLVSKKSFCAAGTDGIPCFGDSGGGFVSEISGKWTILGVVSQTLDNKCTHGGLVVFVNLPLYLDWIETKITEFKKSNPSTFVLTSIPKINPCDFTSCGNLKNSYCEVINSKATCKISHGESECLENFDCSNNKICLNSKCIDPCAFVSCVPNSKCLVINRKAQCECLGDFKLDNFGKCIKNTCDCPLLSRCFESNGKIECRCLDGMTLDSTKTKCQWTCDSGKKRYLMSNRCDGHSDCVDKTDEIKCAKGKTHENWWRSECDLNQNHPDCNRYKTFVLEAETKIDAENFMIYSRRDESVQRIHMSYNKLVEFLPLTVQDRFPNLIEFNFDRNSVRNIKKFCFAGMRKLKVISLEENEIETVEENSFQDLRNLEIISLRENLIVSLPSKVFENLISLTDILLNKNKLEKLDENIFKNSRNLKQILLQINHIWNLPPKIFENLISLKELYLYQNKLETLSENLFKNLRNLEKLYLYENQIVSLPPKIFENLISLKELFLNQNKLEKLDENFFENLTNLEELWLSQNRIASLPPKIFESLILLKELNLSKNKLRTLTENVFNNLRNLEKLWLIENQIVSLPPKIFQNLISLKGLYMNGNKLESFSENLFNNLMNLENVDFGQNKLQNLAQNLFKNNRKINKIWLEENQLQKIDSNIFDHLNVLKYVNFSINPCINNEFGVITNLNVLSNAEKIIMKQKLQRYCN